MKIKLTKIIIFTALLSLILAGCSNKKPDQSTERTLFDDDTLDIQEESLFNTTNFEKDGTQYCKMTSKWIDFSYPIISIKGDDYSNRCGISYYSYNYSGSYCIEEDGQKNIAEEIIGFPMLDFEDDTENVTYTLYNAKVLLTMEKDRSIAIKKGEHLIYESAPLTVSREEYESKCEENNNKSNQVLYPGMCMYILGMNDGSNDYSRMIANELSQLVIKTDALDTEGNTKTHWYNIRLYNDYSFLYYYIMEVM